jgi:hypothetical protein
MNVIRSLYKVPVILVCIFDKPGTIRAHFQKILRYQIKLKPVQFFYADGRTDRQTDMMKLIVFFFNIPNAPKNSYAVRL